VSNADTKADVARGDHDDAPPLSSSSQIGHFIKWKRAKRHTALLHEAGYLLLGLVSLATLTGLYFFLDVPLVAVAFTYLVVLVLLSLVSNLSSLIVLSFIGVCCLSYFFAPPIYSFRVDYSQDLITISAFVITSFVVNFLVTRVRVEQRDQQRDHMRTCETLRDANQRLEVTNEALRIENVERKRAEQAQRESEYKLRQIIDTVPGLIWSADPTGEPTQFNQRLLDYSGIRFEDFQHGGWETFLHPADFPETAKAFYQAIQTGTSYEAVHRLRRSDGEYRWHHARGEPLHDREGRIVQWYGLSVDIDEGKKTEDRLRRSEAYLAEAQRLSHTGSAVYSETEIPYWSDEATRIFGFDPLQGIPSREAVWQRIHPDDLDSVNENIEHAVREKRSFANEFRIILPDGTVKHIEATNYPVLSASGELLEIVATGIDVTERRRAEEALRESEAKFSDYAATASDWLWEIGPDYKFTLLTENAFHSDPADRIGTLCWDHALDLETEPEKWRLVRATLDSRMPFHDFVYCSVDGSGSPMYVKVSGKPVSDANGEFRGYRGTGTDVTAVIRAQRAEASLRTVEAEARESDQRYRKAQLELTHANRVATMGQLTSSIAHEVNQPITAAVTYALAARRWLSAEPPNFREVDDALSLIVKEGNRAGEVVGRIRALIKKLPARKDAVEINDAILEVIALIRTEAANNSVSVRTQLAEGLPRVQGDRVQLQQVLLNLIINAIEAMRDVGEKERELLISSRNEPDGVSVEVRDSGPGFTPAALERVFEAFYTTKPDGLGLGLSICRSIIEAHNGRLWASPNVPRGAIFGFIAPAHPAAAS
jgi:PAS domain S-box-containing protein